MSEEEKRNEADAERGEAADNKAKSDQGAEGPADGSDGGDSTEADGSEPGMTAPPTEASPPAQAPAAPEAEAPQAERPTAEAEAPPMERPGAEAAPSPAPEAPAAAAPGPEAAPPAPEAAASSQPTGASGAPAAAEPPPAPQAAEGAPPVRRKETDEEKAARRKAALEAREAAKAAAAQAAAKPGAPAAGAKAGAAPDGSADAEAPPPPPPSPNQPRLDRAVQLLRESAGEDAVEESWINEPNDHLPTLVVKNERWPACARLFRDHPELNIDYLRNVSGVDYETYMEVVYHLLSLDSGHVYAVKVRTDRDSPSVPSATPVWETANWNEREIYDLLGIDFPGHPDLRRIMMPDDWVGHPLRKDYEPLDPEV